MSSSNLVNMIFAVTCAWVLTGFGPPKLVLANLSWLTFGTSVAGQTSKISRPEVETPSQPATSEREDTSAIHSLVFNRQFARISLIKQVAACVISVFSPSGAAGGSGVIISPDGFALTNFHVAKPCGIAMKCGLPDGQIYDAITVGWDPVGDIALIKLLGRTDFPYAQWGDSDSVAVGDEVLVMGNPFMLATDLQPTVSWGIISALRRYQHPAGTLLEYADCLQTDASINPGNSGGPMFDLSGRLIGINGRASFDRRGRVNVGLAYAVPVNQIRNFLAHLRAGRIVDHASAGFRVASDPQGRPVVVDILETSDAWRRGIRVDDEIISVAGRPILGPNDFKNGLANFPPGWRIPFVFRRGQEVRQVFVRLEPLHSPGELLEQLEKLPLESPPGEEPQPEKPAPTPPPQLPVDHLPPEAQAVYEAKRGFANFYFNRLAQQRLWSAWAEKQGLSQANGEWQLEGRWDSREPFTATLGARLARLSVAGQTVECSADKPPGPAELAPPDLRGPLVGLWLVWQLATQSLQALADLSYWGAEPHRAQGPMAEVLQATSGPAECRWLIHEGLLIAVELHYERFQDPLELVFEDFRSVDSAGKGVLFPHRILILHGDNLLARLEVTSFAVNNRANSESP
ncbi:MAG: trypsin-like peptidase domain-containing protein [Thermoguttaceae bacterium]|nr:trypsin-like peptidase domain-containing protein [Thermoguttaceae bacterium]